MDDALALSRFFEFAPIMILFGAFFFAAVLAPTSLEPALGPALRRIGWPLALIAFAAAAAWLVFVARGMTGGQTDLGALKDVLFGTAFGAVWQARLVLLAALLAAVLWPDRRYALPTLAAGFALASLALVGHAAMQIGWLGAAHRGDHALHLMLTASWLGGLFPFLLCLRLFMRAEAPREALSAMLRYSRFGHFAVPAVLVTGALDFAMTTGRWSWPPNTPYREGLAAKVGVFAAMTALALVNRYVFAPAAGRRPEAARALAAGAVAEIALALVAVALVSGFATLDPN